jgi:hypothetical protein
MKPLMEQSVDDIPSADPMWHVELMLAASGSEIHCSPYPVSRFGTRAELLVLATGDI